MTAALLLAALLVLAATCIHYEALSALNRALPRLTVHPRLKVLVVMLWAFAAHALEIGVYALAYHGAARFPQLGALRGPTEGGFLDSLMFSAEAYTSLGLGDFAPTGPLRLLAGAEALNGLLLIAWTASFTYLSMERFWGERPASRRR